MTDLSSKAKKRKKEQATLTTEAPPKSSQVSFLTPSILLLEIPSQTNTSLPAWDAMHSQQVDIVWTVTPYSINVHFTPLLAKSAQTLTITQPQLVSKPTTPAKRGSSAFSSSQTQPSPAKTSVPPKPPICRPFHTKTSCNVQICERFLTDVCRRGRKCKQHHTPYPFHWQLWCWESDQWVDISPCSQLRMEKMYCDVNREGIQIREGDNLFQDVFTLNFDKMALEFTEKYGRARRLSNTTDPAKNPHFHTKWNVYWWNSHSWEEYREDVSKILLDKMDSEALECWLHIGSQEYKVDFINMLQTNATTGFQRRFRRRPSFRSPMSMEPHLKTGIQSVFTTSPSEPPPANFSVDPLEEFSTWYPPVWTPTPDQDYSMVDVPFNSLAYQKVHSMFHKSLSETRVEIVTIHQIQNVLHWDKYQRYKEYMLKRNTKQDEALERHLFHGTIKKFIEDICHNNFDPRLSGFNGVTYGCGSYFARDSSYSNNFASVTGDGKVKHMFLAKVLVGKVSLGKIRYRRPPPVHPKKEEYDLYDTCVDQLSNPSIFVVFDRCQCYPYYLIKYKDLPEVINILE